MKYMTTSTLRQANASAKTNDREYIDEALIASLPDSLRFPIFDTLPQEANWLRVNIGITATAAPTEEEYESLFLDVKRDLYERLRDVEI